MMSNLHEGRSYQTQTVVQIGGREFLRGAAPAAAAPPVHVSGTDRAPTDSGETFRLLWTGQKHLRLPCERITPLPPGNGGLEP